MSDKERDELAELIANTESPTLAPAWPDRADLSPVKFYSRKTAEAILAAGYRKPRTVTEYGIVFNRNACGLIPPALSLEEFKERYPHETGWSITDRDTYLQRTRQEVDPEPGEWELMPSEPAQ